MIGKIIKAALTIAAISTGTAFLTGTYVKGMFLREFAKFGLAIGVNYLTTKGSNNTTGRNLNTPQAFTNPIASRNTVYGKTRVGGTIVYRDVTLNTKELRHIIAVAAHEINDIKKVYLNNGNDTIELSLTSDFSETSGVYTVTNSNFVNTDNADAYASGGLVKVIYEKGDQTTVNTAIQTELGSSVWTNNHKLQGIAYIYISCIFDDEKWKGYPSFSFEIEGKKVYDPRTATTVYSTNPALIMRDYLKDTVYGFGAFDSEINDATTGAGFVKAANDCDDPITLTAGTEVRYTLNGEYTASEEPQRVLETMLSSCAGQLTYNNGKFNLFVGKERTASGTITDDKLLAPVQITTKASATSLANGVKASYVNASNKYQATEITPYQSSTYLTEDTPSGEASANYEKFITLDLPYTHTTTTAQRLARIALDYSRQDQILSVVVPIEFMTHQVGDIINLDNDRLGYSGKDFEITAMSFEFIEDNYLALRLNLKEYSTTVFDNITYTADPVLPTAPDSGDNTVPAPTGLTLTETTKTPAGGAIAKQFYINAAWTNASDEKIAATEVAYKKSTDTVFVAKSVSYGTTKITESVEPDTTYNFKVRHISSEGIASAYTSVVNITTSASEGTHSAGSVGGVTVDTNKLYLGTGTFNNSNTGFYVDTSGNFSLKDKLSFNGTTLSVDGNITAQNLNVENATVTGTLDAENITLDSIPLDDLFSATGTAQNSTITANNKIHTFNWERDILGTITTYYGLRVDLTQLVPRIGIGVLTTPDDALHIRQAQPYIRLDDTTNNHWSRIKGIDGNIELSADPSVGQANSYISFDIDNALVAKFKGGGGLEISSATPSTTTNTLYNSSGTLYWNGSQVGVGAVNSVTNMVDNRVLTASGSNSINGEANLTFDGSTLGVTGSVEVSGDLTVNGTTVTLNTTTLDVEDKNITLNYGAGDTSASANGAGITIQDAVNATTDATILWNTTSDEFDFSHGINITQGDFTVADAVDLQGTLTVAGTLTANNGINLGDNDKAQFGAGNDLQIYHNGSNSFVDDAGTGDLYIRSNRVYIGKYTGEVGLSVLADGAVNLNYDNATKLVTTSTGIDVTGVAVVDGLTSSAAITSTSNSNSLGGTTFTSAVSGTSLSLSASITASGNSNSFGNMTAGTISSGQITTSGGVEVGSNNINFADNGRVRFGNSADLQIYHNGTHSFIEESGTGDLYIRTSSDDGDVLIQSDNGSGGISTYFRADGSNTQAQLFFGGSQKLNTKSDGVDITGELQSDSLDVDGTSNLSDHITLSRGGGQFITKDNNSQYLLFSGGNSGDSGQIILGGGTNGTYTGNVVLRTGTTTTTTALTLDSSQNATFAGTIDSGAINSTGQFSVNTGATGTLAQFRGADTDLLNIDGDSNAITLDARNVGAFNIEMQGTNALTIDNSQNATFAGTISSGAITSSSSITSSEFINTATTSNATTPVNTAGWFKIAKVVRGAGRILLSFIGGNYAPDTYVIDYYKDWTTGASLFLKKTGGTGFITKAKIRQDTSDSNYYVEIYCASNSNGLSFQVYHQRLQGFFSTSNEVYGGSLSAGSTSGTDIVSEQSFVSKGIWTEGIEADYYYGNVNISSGSLKLNDTTVIDSSRNLTNIDSLTFTGTSGTTVSIPSHAGFEIDITGSTAGNIRANDDLYLLSQTGKLHLGANGTNSRLVVNESGLVGIGTTSPDTLLEAEGTGSLPLFLSRQQNVAGVGVGLGFRQYDSTNALHNYASIFGVIEDNTNGAEDGSLTFHTSLSGSLGERMRIDEEGNVGIGTTNPDKALTISASDSQIRLYDADGTNQFASFQSDNGITKITSRNNISNGQIAFQRYDGTTVAESMRIDSSGRVGIGLTSPSSTLHVVSTGTTTGGAYVYSNAIHTGSDTHSLLSVRSDNASATGTVVDIRGDGTGDILNVKDGTSTALIVKNGGNVGIGNTSPARRLVVGDGSGSEILSIYAGSTSASALHFTDTNTTTDYQGFVTYNHVDEALRFGAAEAEGMRLTSTGLGIGTTSPPKRLHVKSDVADESAVTISLSDNTNDTSQGGLGVRAGGTVSLIGNNRLDFYTGSSERMRITSTGNVGIRTTTPAKQLHIYQPSGETGFMLSRTNNVTGVNLQLSVDSTKTRIIGYGDGLTFWTNTSGDGTNATERMRIDSTGDVLINNSSFDVSGVLNVSNSNDNSNVNLIVAESERTGAVGAGLVLHHKSTSPAANDYNFITFSGKDAGAANTSYSEIRGLIDATTAGAEQGNLAFLVSNAGSLAERMRIDHSGNVGVGTTSPETKLHVFKGESGGAAANTQSSLVLENNTNTYLQFLTPTNVESGLLFGDTDNDAGAFTYNHSTNTFAFRTNGVSNRMVIDSSGNVGIGITSSLVHRLEVAGSIYANASNDAGFRMNGGNNIFRQNSTEMGFETNNTERMRLNATGLGIGTSNPEGEIHVVGATGSQGRIYVSDADNGAGGSDSLLITKSGTVAYVYNRDNGSMRFGANNNGNHIVIQTDGDVGINTASPAQKLDVNGNIGVGGTEVITSSRNIRNVPSAQFTGGSFSSGIDTVTDAGIVLSRTKPIYSNDGNYLRKLLTHDASNNIIIGQFGTGLIGSIYLQSGSSGTIFFNTNGSTSTGAKVDSSGNFIAQGNVTAYGTVSDIRRKENIEIIPNALDKIKTLDGITFNFKDRPEERMTGVIAQQVEKVLPEAVYETITMKDEETKAVHYGNMVGLLIEAIKELKAEIEELKKA